LTLNNIPDVKLSNIEIIVFILAFLAFLPFISLTIFAKLWIAMGLFVFFLIYQFNSSRESNYLTLEEHFKRNKKKINIDFNYPIDITKGYRWFPDIALLIQKIRIIK